MPEADAVWRTAAELDRHLSGRRLVSSDFRTPRWATTDLSGFTVADTVRHGKHLFTPVRSERGQWFLHTHRKMDGKWVFPRGTALPGPAHQIRLVLRTSESTAVAVAMPVLELLSPTDTERMIAGLGPDILAADLETPVLAEQMSHRDQPVGELLLDQRVIAGLGTMWVAEACHQAAVSPWAQRLSAATLLTVLDAAQTLVRNAVTNRHRPRMRVYRRLRRPCPRCGGPIRSDPIGSGATARRLFWCPACQRESG